jgi:hypothetical protein
MKSNIEQLEEIIEQYDNGNKKDFVKLVDEYGLYSVWDNLRDILTTIYFQADADARLVKMVVSYHYIKYR